MRRYCCASFSRCRTAPRSSLKSRTWWLQRPWHILNFLPLPHGHGALRGVLSHSVFTTGVLTTSSSCCGIGSAEPPASTAACCAAAAARLEPLLDGSSGPDICMFETPSCGADDCWVTETC